MSEGSRRTFLRNAFVSSVLGGLAGCSGDGSESTVTPLGNESAGASTGSGGSATVDSAFETVLEIPSTTPIENAQYNPYSPAAKYDFRWYWAQFDMLGVYDRIEGTTRGVILKDWSYDDDGTATWTLRDTYTWHDGSDLTAEDVVTQLKIGQLMGTVHKGYGSAPGYENVRQTGTYELQFDLKRPDVNLDIFHIGHVSHRTWLWAHRDIWGKYAEGFDDATTEDELTDLRQDLTNDTKRPITDTSVLPGNSVWNPVESGGQTLRYEPYEEYESPFGDVTGADVDYGLTSTYYPNQQQRTQAMLAGELDVGFAPKSQSARDEVAAKGFGPSRGFPVSEVEPWMRNLSMGYWFNMQDPITGRRKVRQAIYHAVPRVPVIKWHQDYRKAYTADRVPTGMGQDKEVPWYDDWPDALDSHTQYAYESANPERAAELLREEGFSKRNGRWVDPDGEEFTLEMYGPTSTEEPVNFKCGQVMETYLDDFGLDTRLTIQEGSIRSSNTQPSGDWQLMTFYPSSFPGGHPFFAFDLTFPFTKTYDGDPLDGRQSWGMADTVEVPYPVGNPDGDLRQVNVREKVAKLRTELPDAEERELVHELGWIQNQLVPFFATTERGGVGGSWINKDEWKTPGPAGGDNPVYRYMVIEIGEYSLPQYCSKLPKQWFGPKTGSN